HHTLSIPSVIGLVLVIAGASATGGYLFGFESGKDKVKASHITASAVGLTKAQKLIAEDTLTGRIDFILQQDVSRRFDLQVIPVEVASNKECMAWRQP
ncbi:hypothetical protein, partial [Pseudomonas aeruginosa]